MKLQFVNELITHTSLGNWGYEKLERWYLTWLVCSNLLEESFLRRNTFLLRLSGPDRRWTRHPVPPDDGRLGGTGLYCCWELQRNRYAQVTNYVHWPIGKYLTILGRYFIGLMIFSPYLWKTLWNFLAMVVPGMHNWFTVCWAVEAGGGPCITGAVSASINVVTVLVVQTFRTHPEMSNKSLTFTTVMFI